MVLSILRGYYLEKTNKKTPATSQKKQNNIQSQQQQNRQEKDNSNSIFNRHVRETEINKSMQINKKERRPVEWKFELLLQVLQ